MFKLGDAVKTAKKNRGRPIKWIVSKIEDTNPISYEITKATDPDIKYVVSEDLIQRYKEANHGDQNPSG